MKNAAAWMADFRPAALDRAQRMTDIAKTHGACRKWRSRMPAPS